MKSKFAFSHRSKRFSYYPGCTLHSSAREFDLSTKAVCAALDIELVEIPDWNCCGATSAHSTSEKLSVGLAARNLLIAQIEGYDLVMPCAACYNRIKVSENALESSVELREELAKSFGLEGENLPRIEAKHLLELFRDESLLAKVREKTLHSLEELKAVCYYGCLLVRPPGILHFDNPENPQIMDVLMKAIGVSVLDWAYKVDCCGASLSLSRPDIVAKLTKTLLLMAKEADAECIITACPMCHANLDIWQNGVSPPDEDEMNADDEDKKMPIFYFTELMGIAFGIPKAESWLKKHFVDATLLLKDRSVF